MAGSLDTPKSKAADLLLRAKVLEKRQYDQIVQLVRQLNDRAEEVIVEQEFMSEGDLLKALSGIYRTQFVSSEKLAKVEIPRATIQIIPQRVAETLGVFPVLFDPKTSVLSVVTPDPDNGDVLREVKLVSGAREIKAFVARPAAVAAAIKKHHTGDLRAFEQLDRQASALTYDFGHGRGPSGRARAEPEISHRPNGGAAVAPPPAPRPAPPPVPKPPQIVNVFPQVEALDDDDVVPDKPERPEAASARPKAAPPAAKPSVSLSLPPPKRELAAPPPAPRLSVAPVSAAAMGSMPPPLGDKGQSALANDTTIELLTVMVSLLENSRQELRGHSSQVARLLRRIAERMSLDRSATYAFILAGHIHDLGKMGQFHLTALNCSEYEGHRTAASKAHDTPLRLLEAVRLPETIKNAVFHMYERFDGTGFPDKLVGKEIPLGARLLAVADSYADLTQNPRNPFRKALGPQDAINVLMKHKGTIFDPGILDLIKSLVLGEDMVSKLLANRHRALVVDPDPEESTVLELRMVEQGFDVKTARTVDAARKLLSTEGVEFDLVVCEVELPDGNGLSFLAEARKESWGRDLPWIVHTSKQGRAEAQKAFSLGAMDFVSKPVQADVLVAKLKAMLEQWSTGKSSKGVSGSLSEMGLPDIVQVLFHGRKTGKLNIRSSGKTGEIHFLEGNIANAICGDQKGADAFYAMVRFIEGDFALDPSFTPGERVIAESSEALLLEGMRRMDEGI